MVRHTWIESNENVEKFSFIFYFGDLKRQTSADEWLEFRKEYVEETRDGCKTSQHLIPIQ